ncbi:MAG: MFS transporter [Gammaproteobacteria bacterium]|nr:MFS transporter [Gammaproteobacteria bacterium]
MQKKLTPLDRAQLHYRILAWITACAFYFYQFLLQVVPSVLKPEIQSQFNLSAQGFGAIAAFLLYAYAAMQIPVGLLLDRYGPRRILPYAALLCAFGSLLFGMATTYQAAILGRFLTGIGGAFAVIGCFKVAAMEFEARHFSMLTGLTVMIGMSGAAFGQALLGPVLHKMPHWQDVFYILFFVGVGIAGLMVLLLPNHSAHPVEEVKSTKQLKDELILVLKNPCTWVAAFYAGLMYTPTLALGEAWGIAFLVEAIGLSREAAHQIVPTLFIGWAIGSFVFGFLTEFIERSWLMISSSFCVALIYRMIAEPNFALTDVSMWTFLFFILGLTSAGFILAFTSAKEANHESMAATASGVMNTMNTLCGAIAQQLIGFLLDQRLANPQATTSVLHNYQKAFSCIEYALWISVFLSIVLMMMEKPNPFDEKSHPSTSK